MLCMVEHHLGDIKMRDDLKASKTFQGIGIAVFLSIPIWILIVTILDNTFF